MSKCDDCNKYGLSFNREYIPEEFIEGHKNSPVWIIGLNPAAEIAHDDLRTASDLIDFLESEKIKHPYFKNFSKVSQKLYEKLGAIDGVAHTDIVKCFSKSWPKSGTNTIVKNCTKYLERQIVKYKPKMLICNGSTVSRFIMEIIPPSPTIISIEKITSYHAIYKGESICIVLSGFIGRIDDCSKRRLGVEVESHLLALKLF